MTQYTLSGPSARGAADSPVIGRFAPTPSGRMHLGNAYAMLAAWLSARSREGRMLLRIEDIDRPRVLPDADRWIMDDLTWLGLDWDGEPVYQSERLDLYEDALERLRDGGRIAADAAGMPACASADDMGVEDGAAVLPAEANQSAPTIYPCFCSRADIRAASAPQEGDGFVVYPGTCRRLAREHPDEMRARLAEGRRHSLRLAVPERDVSFDDEVFGPQRFNLARDLGDTVMRRADGLFAYQFVVTIDDLLMGVTDIVRGRDLLRSTALQEHLRGLLGGVGFGCEAAPRRSGDLRADDGALETHNAAAPEEAHEIGASTYTPWHPRYAHLPLVDNAAGRRLAKRERSLDLGVLRARGIKAEQVVGYCAWLLRLIPEPAPCAPRDLLGDFSWAPLRAEHADRAVPDDPFV